MMNTMQYINKLESLIADGETLRDEMRSKSSAKDGVIRAQAGQLADLRHRNEVLQKLRARASGRMNVAKNEAAGLRSKLEKRDKHREHDRIFLEAVKAAAMESGIWEQLRNEALRRMADF